MSKGQWDGRMPNRYITLSAGCGRRKQSKVEIVLVKMANTGKASVRLKLRARYDLRDVFDNL